MISSISKFRKMLKKWYLPLIVGIVFLLVALGIYSLPGLSISILMLLFSSTIIIFGIRETVFVVSNRMLLKNWIWHLCSALCTIIIGILLIRNPFLGIAYINFIVVAVLIVKAIRNLVFHYTYRRRTQRTIGMNWIYSVALFFIAIFLWCEPQIISTFIITLSGLPFLIMGMLSITLAISLRKTHKRLEAFKSSFRETTSDADFQIIESDLDQNNQYKTENNNKYEN
jgi:uncharacterized membrane protein HdeD (DUF308 family)